MTKLGAWEWGKKGGWKGKRREENFREWNRQDGGRTEMRARKERFLIEGAIMRLTRNMTI